MYPRNFSSLVIALLAFFSLSSVICLAANPKEQYQTAKLVEAVEWEPCDYYCYMFNHPATEYCFQVNGQALVGERRGFLWLGESDDESMRSFAGKEVSIRYDTNTIWIERIGHSPLKIKRGSIFEGFKDNGCLIEVHKPKLVLAAASKRPANVPADAFAIAGKQTGDFQSQTVFLWFECKMSKDADTIDCKKWFPRGTPVGVDRYCARTTQGDAVPADFEIDWLASRQGRIVLKRGGVLGLDNRGRTNDELHHPGEACRTEFGPNT
jgi:hypothetical protein